MDRDLDRNLDLDLGPNGSVETAAGCGLTGDSVFGVEEENALKGGRETLGVSLLRAFGEILEERSGEIVFPSLEALVAKAVDEDVVMTAATAGAVVV